MEPLYEIKITGSGTRNELIRNLRVVTDSIQYLPESDIEDAEWEDAILMTEIKRLNDEL